MRFSVQAVLVVALMACFVVGGVSYVSNPLLCIAAWGAFVVIAFAADSYMQYRDLFLTAVVVVSLILVMIFIAGTGFSTVFDSVQLTVVSSAVILGLVLSIAMHFLCLKYADQPKVKYQQL